MRLFSFHYIIFFSFITSDDNETRFSRFLLHLPLFFFCIWYTYTDREEDFSSPSLLLLFFYIETLRASGRGSKGMEKGIHTAARHVRLIHAMCVDICRWQVIAGGMGGHGWHATDETFSFLFLPHF